jgi:hypothetical protein
MGESRAEAGDRKSEDTLGGDLVATRSSSEHCCDSQLARSVFSYRMLGGCGGSQPPIPNTSPLHAGTSEIGLQPPRIDPTANSHLRRSGLENRCTGNRTVGFESHPLRQEPLILNGCAVLGSPYLRFDLQNYRLPFGLGITLPFSPRSTHRAVRLFSQPLFATESSPQS